MVTAALLLLRRFKASTPSRIVFYFLAEINFVFHASLIQFNYYRPVAVISPELFLYFLTDRGIFVQLSKTSVTGGLIYNTTSIF